MIKDLHLLFTIEEKLKPGKKSGKKFVDTQNKIFEFSLYICVFGICIYILLFYDSQDKTV